MPAVSAWVFGFGAAVSEGRERRFLLGRPDPWEGVEMAPGAGPLSAGPGAAALGQGPGTREAEVGMSHSRSPEISQASHQLSSVAGPGAHLPVLRSFQPRDGVLERGQMLTAPCPPVLQVLVGFHLSLEATRPPRRGRRDALGWPLRWRVRQLVGTGVDMV